MLDRFKDAQWMVEKRELQVDGGDTSPGSHGSVTHLVWDTASPDDWTNVIAHIVEDRIPGIAEANARLIARSPELLRIVEFLGEWVEAGADVIHLGALYGDGDGDYSLADAVRDALQA